MIVFDCINLNIVFGIVVGVVGCSGLGKIIFICLI
jgi:ABC-type transporter Mla maintaining outer membrane lipid asymmetry ATPase subunit MlaF